MARIPENDKQVGNLILASDFTSLKNGVNDLYPVSAAHTNVLNFTKEEFTSTSLSQSAAIAYTLGAGPHVDGMVKVIEVLSDGVNPITFSTDFRVYNKSADDIYPSGFHEFWCCYLNGTVRVSIPTYATAGTGTGGETGGTGDTSVATLSSATVESLYPNRLVLTYSEPLDTASVPAGAAFSFTPSRTVSGVTISASVVTVTVSQPFASTDVISFAYTKGAAPIQDVAGNDAANIASWAVINNVKDYYSLSNVELILDDEGLAANTANTYGTVDSTGGVTTWKSLAPGPTGRDFTAVGTAPKIGASGIDLVGTGNFTNATKALWKFLHYHASGITSLKYTLHFVVQMGNSADPNAVYCLFGNNGTSATSVGANAQYDDRVSTGANNGLTFQVSRGVIDSPIHSTVNTSTDPDTQISNVMTPNKLSVITIEYDGSLSLANRMKFYQDGTNIPMPVAVSGSTALSAGDPTYGLDLFAGGNSVVRAIGKARAVIFQSRIESALVRAGVIDYMRFKKGVA
ncbi:hypothetical protein GCM10023188_25850 [Pontibacter saemangeumensis]|uniref:Uncharacterized protein n=1 Tax=Pontibacter saemangeumensis TaxID=1084525 RepID=A0ABP8LU24_9BACT